MAYHPGCRVVLSCRTTSSVSGRPFCSYGSQRARAADGAGMASPPLPPLLGKEEDDGGEGGWAGKNEDCKAGLGWADSREGAGGGMWGCNGGLRSAAVSHAASSAACSAVCTLNEGVPQLQLAHGRAAALEPKQRADANDGGVEVKPPMRVRAALRPAGRAECRSSDLMTARLHRSASHMATLTTDART